MYKLNNVEDISIKFCSNVKNIRIKQNLTQSQLAYEAGIPTNQIGRIERNEISPSLNTIIKICNALDISITELFE